MNLFFRVIGKMLLDILKLILIFGWIFLITVLFTSSKLLSLVFMAILCLICLLTIVGAIFTWIFDIYEKEKNKLLNKKIKKEI